MQRLFATALVLAFATTAIAQSARHSHKHTAPAAPEVPSAKQSEEMKKMTDTFAGQWKTTATIEKSDFFPLAGTATGRSDFRSGPAGNSLVERARSHGAMGLFAGLGLLWWDAKAAAYHGMWCDSLAPDGCDPMGAGQWSGNSLVFTSEADMGQNKLQLRETYSNITTDSFTFTMEAGMDGAPLAKVMTIQYDRVQPRTVVVPNPTPAPVAPPASTPEATPKPT